MQFRPQTEFGNEYLSSYLKRTLTVNDKAEIVN